MSEDKEDRDKVIRQVYYDTQTGFGSIAETFKESKKILNTITYNDVKDFLERQKVRQFKAYRGFNSYVATEPLQEMQVDIADFTASGAVNDGYRYCFVAIDIFTKYCHAVPIKDKKPAESVRAMKEVLNKIGIPKTIYHDFEGSWNSKEFIQVLNLAKIKQIITSTPPPFAERMIQTIKNMIHTRLEGLEMSKEKWVELLPTILKKYNNTKHSTIDMSPNNAKQGNNNIEIWLNIYNKAKFNRKYPPIKMGSEVRTYIKPKTMTKGYESKWSASVYKVIAVSDDGKQYMVNNNTRKLYSRHELLLVRGAEGKDD
ncbi:MAG: transposase family protein [Roseovarius sp.]